MEKQVLRWGGLAGSAGGIAFIVVFVVVGVFVGTDFSADAEEAVKRFPDIRAARTVENGLYLLVLVCWVPHFLALYRTLRDRGPAPALFGSVLATVGLGVMAAGALPHVATLPISDLYHAPGATPEDQSAAVVAWQATAGVFDALLFVGLALVPIGLVLLGVAMYANPAFGKGFGGLSVVLGVLGVAAAIVLVIDPTSGIAAVGIFALIVFNLVLGWKVFTLSRAE